MKICSLWEAQEAHTYKARMKCIVQHNKKNPDRSDTKKEVFALTGFFCHAVRSNS